MARTLEQLDTAVSALEVQINNTYRGLMETMRGLSLMLEARFASLEQILGSAPGSSSSGSGLLADVAAIRILLEDLRTRVEQLEQPQP